MNATTEERVRPTFDPTRRVYRVEHDEGSPWPASTTIVLAVSSLTEVEPTDLLPLNGVVDPDALEHHVRGKAHGARLSFDFHGFHVTVRDDGHVELDSDEDRWESAGTRVGVEER